MKRFRQKQMKLHELTQRGMGDAADYFSESDKKYGRTEWTVPAVVQPQMAHDAVSSETTTFGEPMETLIACPENSKCHKGHLHQGAVI